MFDLYWSLFCLLALFAVLYMLLRPMIRGAIYFPTDPERVKMMMALLAPRAGQRIADIGSGDGRIVIALAAQGVEAHGYEINPILVWRSRRAIRARGLRDRAFIHWKDFWRVGFGSFDAVVVYGFPNIMRSLARKLEKELPQGAKIISNDYRFPDWEPAARNGRIFLYEKGPPSHAT